MSLIELLVVMAILAVLAVGVSIVPARFGAAGVQARVGFSTQFAALQDLAVQGRAVYGLRVGPRQMQVMRLRGGTWQEMGQWQGRAVLAGAQGRAGAPDILILPDGRYSAFDLRVAGGQCSGDGWGPVRCDG